MSRLLVAVALFITLISVGVLGFNQWVGRKETLTQEAQVSYLTQNWPAAEEKLKHVTQLDPSNNEAWFQLGLAHHYQKEFAEAKNAFERSIETGHTRGPALYNIACGYALQNRKDEAMTLLREALQSGMKEPNVVFSDPDLNSLRGTSEFQAFVLELKRHPNSPTFPRQ